MIINKINLEKEGIQVLESFLNNRRQDNKDISDIVENIINDVKANGDVALLDYTAQFDKVSMISREIRVSEEEIKEAYTLVDSELVEIMKRAAANIDDFHSRQKAESLIYDKTGDSGKPLGIKLGILRRPVDKAGVYVPAGTAPLPSSVLMNIIPAKVAGVNKIVMVTPPGKDGKANPVILVAADIAGADEIYKAGGAQAIAALAYGTETIPKVDIITGPGNIFVATAKKKVYGQCDIDMIAGPSEILIIADETAVPEFVAADLLSQAEHDKLASAILITTSAELAERVETELGKQLQALSRMETASESLKNYGAIVVANDLESAVSAANKVAPEHLELCVENPEDSIEKIKNAGAIFIGNYTPEPLGDYYAGPNHVLPTTGTARFYSPLNVWTFIKQTSIIKYTKDALLNCAGDVMKFAQAEQLDAHAKAVEIRINNK